MVNVQTELNCIKKLLDERNPELLVKLDLSHFGNEEVGKLFLLVKKFYIENGKWMGWDVLRSIVAQKCTSADKSRYLMGILDQIQARDISGLSDEMLITDMENTGTCRAVLGTISELVAAAEQRDLDAVIGLYRKGYDLIFMKDDSSLDDCDMAVMAGKKIKYNFNATGLEPIDERGGLIEGGLFGIAGESKAGKSVMALGWAVHQYLHLGESSAYFSYEQSKGEIRARILSSLSEIDIGKISTDDLSDEERIKLRATELSFICVPQQDMEAYCRETINKDDEEFWDDAKAKYELRDNKFLIFDDALDWDALFIRMALLRSTKGVGYFTIDYPYLVPRGAADRNLQTWEYNLLQSRKLKHFARTNSSRGLPTRVTVLAQYDSKEDSLRYVKGLVNDLDMLVKISRDKEDVEMGTVTCSHGGIYRSFLTVPGKPELRDFKLVRDFSFSRFQYMEF